jgi:hypothetical protein
MQENFNNVHESIGTEVTQNTPDDFIKTTKIAIADAYKKEGAGFIPEVWLRNYFKNLPEYAEIIDKSKTDVSWKNAYQELEGFAMDVNRSGEFDGRGGFTAKNEPRPDLEYYDNKRERGRSTGLQASFGEWKPNDLNS